MTEIGSRRTEVRDQKPEIGSRKAEGRGRKSEIIFHPATILTALSMDSLKNFLFIQVV